MLICVQENVLQGMVIIEIQTPTGQASISKC